MTRPSILAAGCAIVPIIISIIFSISSNIFTPGSRWLPATVFTCFLFTLVISHYIFFSIARIRSKDLPKIIDYVYLSIAMMGVIFTVFQFGNQQYKEDLVYLFNHANTLFEQDMLDLHRLESACKAYELKDGGACFKFFDEVDHFDASVRAYRSAQTRESLFDTMKIFQKTYATYQTTPASKEFSQAEINKETALQPTDMEAWHKQDKAATIRYLEKLDMDTPLFNDRGINFLRYFGIMLISSSIALRITKVSIEYFDSAPRK